MRRRDFLLGSGSAIIAGRDAFSDEDAKPAKIGILHPLSRDTPYVSVFLAELSKLGYEEGRNLWVDFRQVPEEAGPDTTAAAAALAQEQVQLIYSGTPAQLQAAINMAPTIPSVFTAISFDPVARGYVRSFAHPGGNATGVYLRTLDLVCKQLEILHQMVPNTRRLGVLWESNTDDEFAEAQRCAAVLRLEVEAVQVQRPPNDLDLAFERLVRRRPGMLLIVTGPNLRAQRQRIADLARRYRLPTMFKFRDYVEAGGLMSYGVDRLALFRRAANLAARILQGTQPADLPIEQADRFELVINLATARALGISVPQLLLARADEVIE